MARSHPLAAEAPDVATRPASSRRAILLVLLGWFLFACMDAGSKILAQDYAIIQILWVRYLVLAAIACVLARRQGTLAVWRTAHPWLQTVRSALLVTEIGLFIYAITVLPLADAHAIVAATPLIVTALSVPVLGERVGVRRWSAIGVAFLGVLVILRPGFGALQPMSLIALLSAVMFALYQVLTRLVSRKDSASLTLLFTSIVGAAGLSVIGPFFWTWPDLEGWLLLATVSLVGAAGHFLLIKALQLAPAALLQPFSYTLLVWATLVGFVAFGNLPDLWTVSGAAIIVASGLYAFAREQRRKREPAG